MIKVSNIKSVVTWDTKKNDLSIQKDKLIYIKDNKIVEISNQKLNFDYEIDAENSNITPGFIDCHTHPIFSGNRAKEFSMREQGKSYQKIAQSGGGIISSIEKLVECELQLSNSSFQSSGLESLEKKCSISFVAG